jgi:outer membrane protein OmpA-like peptidoglycan-associated protein
MRARQLLLSGAAILTLASCGGHEAGSEVDMGTFGNANMNNSLVMTGQRDYVVALQDRFNQEVQDTITFAFNSATLDAEAIKVLRHQANWIKQFPELRFRVYGHTDLVGSNGYNYGLGKRRAQAVVAYFASQGISRSRLEALVSYGETRPVVQTQSEERRNRRTVTEVSGFMQRHPTLLNGKYAEVIFREYIKLAERPHPQNVIQETQTNPEG